MGIKDDLLKIRVATTAVTSTEAGRTTKTRHTTGAVVVEIDKCPEGGVPIEMIAAADTGTSNDKTMIVTIEGSDELASELLTVATFPTLTYDDTTAVCMVRRVATQLKYLRSVITVAGSNGTISRNFEINVGVSLLDDDGGYTG